MILMPINTDFGLLNSSAGLLFGMKLRDFKEDTVRFRVASIVLGVFMYVEAGYDTYLARRAATTLPVQMLTHSQKEEQLRAETQNLRERAHRA